MINKRIKQGFDNLHNDNHKIKFCLGALALVAICVLLLIISTFTQIKLNFNLPSHGIDSYLNFEYIPQIPVVIFIAALLGEVWGVFSVLIYIVMGLTPWFPVFALGGGASYIFQYNFGYIFAYIFSVILCAKELKRGNGILNIIFAMLYGVLTIHVIGIIYMIIIALIRHDSFQFMQNWIYYQSLSKILYDIIFGILAVLLAKGCRKMLWLVMG